MPSAPERIVRLEDAATGLSGAIVIDSTRLGPAAGGCRLWHYADGAAVLADAQRLARGMSYKNALAGLPLGGGKAVISRPRGSFDRAALFAAFGRAVRALDGAYVTAEDVGTGVEDMTHVATMTRHVAGLTQVPGRAGGDPSPWTARGVFSAMRVAAERGLGRPLEDMVVAVQGLGHVGFALCALLDAAGAQLIVADPNAEAAARAAEMFGAAVVDPAAILDADADIFAPCALGGAIGDAALDRLKARVVCGAANNQLATAAHGDRLMERGILYAPDYVANAGGIINVAAEYLGWPLAQVAERVDAIGARLGEVFDRAAEEGIAPGRAADRLAAALIAAAPAYSLAGAPPA
ncbi:Glu/Leu/Phe/Val dehydrogenase [Sphingomonas canadensis]|uniref:Glu/Leu/Phe/Val dehydrogenase n=1 Tax=Sphingomonas canadensis TaxID=1219257 RepID=A0ABW3HFA2_9SPHN|nr:Glu/Leu/Phe/Val dehydrogenase dimerization domain-containing protein [Sphingomonas canadensis]MCW3838095.1 amino acid dehydrogenase [Sphingomonas canadensis]